MISVLFFEINPEKFFQNPAFSVFGAAFFINHSFITHNTC
ncbi:hypothetical protein CHK_3143 [Christensenella hongkongensis]|uniref:Uncharacterized protein n=1 Tax=Christensenella hongkongensis TaxID=270498 RepID=A0A0M2NH10_9FIRM|nr:hypothetical protein CHK_3143 [Christensenella hongkongensis]